MESFQVLTIIIAIVAANLGIIIPLFLWNRSEANADRKTAHEDRKDILTLIRAIEMEMKDFHGRLCAIEERNRGK